MNIVLLPGLDGTGSLLVEIRDLLASHYPVTALSYPTDMATYDELQQWVMRSLPDGNFVLVAESFSGPLAAMIRAKNLPNHLGTVFVATFARSPRRVPSCLTYLLRIVPVRSLFLARLVQPALMGKWSDVEFAKRFAQAMAIIPAKTLSRRLAEVLNVDVTSELRMSSAPMSYLRATHDRLIPAKMSGDFAANGSQLSDVDGPHFLLQANASDAGAQIVAFCGSVERCSNSNASN
ncbi:hypothetical protein SAMN04488030_2842 [Aliiroseovarius halocynthiae]|nr:alpha/beta hydrolase [Aliiroseovarius halocynthiae]SMR82489.1 hypothetical protein SAMN04488030_2842 [Aliiroseovarius halocynthiae]